MTTGVPAAVRPVPGAAAVARELCALQGCAEAELVTSTLHGAWDLGGMIDGRREAVYVDADVYPILRVAALRARIRGVTVRDVRHHEPAALERSMRGDRRRPVVLVDGISPAAGGAAPLRAYLEVARRGGGLLVVDDTQAVGILGEPGGAVPAWGRGGGGSLPHHGLRRAPDVLLLTSFAKALGAPIGALGGSPELIERYRSGADTRVHCSPASVAAVRALEHALASQPRPRRAAAVGSRRAPSCASGGGWASSACVQTAARCPSRRCRNCPSRRRQALHRHLLAHGIYAVPQQSARRALRGAKCSYSPRGTTDADVDAACEAVARAPQLELLRRDRRDRAAA